MGLGSCLWKTIICPCALIFHALRIYVLGCIGVYLDRGFRGLCCGLCVCCGCTYKDKEFPPTARSIGPIKGQSPVQLNESIEWKRLKTICAKSGDEGARLFAGDINPNDICQGQLGDCWLMSALACLAQVEGAIQQCFIIREYTHYGKYKIRLWDKPAKKFRTITVDDWVPCKRGTTQTLFAQPRGDEAWVLLLEKAFAKFMGSYHNLDGGSTLYAFQALTGNYVFKFQQNRPGGKMCWDRFDLVHGKRKGEFLLASTKDQLKGDEMFQTLIFYTKKRSVIAASSGGDGNDTQDKDGIVQGHAYSLIDAREVKGFRMVRLRNPWGTFEWKGDWGDNSPLWRDNPGVARALDFKPSDDGSFWMEFDDFCQYFRNLDFCFRTTGWNDLVLDIHEDSPCCGPVIGCVGGCLGYWCCCKGLRAHCCGNEEQKFQRAPQGCCAMACVC